MITATNNENKDQTLETESGFSVSKINKKGLYGMIMIKELEDIINSNTIKWTKCSKTTGENYIPKFFFEKCYNILNCIVESKDGSVSGNMFEKIDSHYSDYLRFLTELELMECIDKNYSIYKHTSKKYKVSKTILNEQKYEVKDSRLLAFKGHMEKKKLKEFKKYNNSENVTIGLSKKYVYEALSEHFSNLTADERSKNIKVAYGNYCQINSGNIFGAIENDSRLHSNFTRIPKCIRRLVYNNVEELVEFDIHATHIFLLPKTIENMLRNEEKKKAVNLSYLSETRIANIRKDITSFTEMLESCFDSDVDVYSEFAKEYGQDITREDIKINLLSWINNETGFGYDKIDAMFDTLFPYIKQYMKDKKNGKFNVFNFELTRLETGLILPICEEIVKAGMTLISVHDCLMFRKKDQETIFGIIKKHMEEKECTLLTWKEKNFNINSSLISSSPTHLASLDNDLMDFDVVSSYKQEIRTKKDSTQLGGPSYFVSNLIKNDTTCNGMSVANTSGTCGTSVYQGNVIEIDKIREIDNNGSRAWMYRGTGKQQMKASCKKMTKEQFLAKVNEKFRTGEWK